MKKLVLAAASVLISLGGLLLSAQPDGLLHVYFLNVGRGSSVLLRTPSGKNILIDGGSKNTVLGELKSVLPFFGNTIDYLILTNPDRNHIEGLVYVLKRYPVRRVLLGKIMPKQKTFLTDAFLQTIKEKNIPSAIAGEKTSIQLEDGVAINILSANPIAVKVAYGKESMFLTGPSVHQNKLKKRIEFIVSKTKILSTKTQD